MNYHYKQFNRCFCSALSWFLQYGPLGKVEYPEPNGAVVPLLFIQDASLVYGLAFSVLGCRGLIFKLLNS